MSPLQAQKIAQAIQPVQSILLLGGPSGSGKTTVASALIDHSLTSPFLKDRPEATIERTDSASLEKKHFPHDIVIVEFATNRIQSQAEIEFTKSYIQLLGEHCHILGAHTIELNPKQAFSRYLSRMGPKQYLHLGKWKTLGLYAFDINISSGLKNWHALLQDLKIEDKPIALDPSQIKTDQ